VLVDDAFDLLGMKTGFASDVGLGRADVFRGTDGFSSFFTRWDFVWWLTVA
jgi:hypothetical protein